MKLMVFPLFNMLNSTMVMKITIVLLLVFSLAGCGSRRVLMGLSPDEIRTQPTVMVANCPIYCGNIKIESGAAFSIEKVGGEEYHVHSPSLLSTVADMLTHVNTFTFPEEVLLLPYPDGDDGSYLNSSIGFLVYPNGKLAYEKYYAVGYNNVGGTWWMIPGECTPSCEYLFRLQDNR